MLLQRYNIDITPFFDRNTCKDFTFGHVEIQSSGSPAEMAT